MLAMLSFIGGMIVGVLLTIAGMVCELIFLAKVNKGGVVESLRRKVEKNTGGMAEIVDTSSDEVDDWIADLKRE